MNYTPTKCVGGVGQQNSSYKSYFIGFVLSMILTGIPFFLVIQSNITKNILLLILIGCAILQILVHLIYFLHLNTSFEKKWNVIAFLFMILIVSILVIGSLWIMWHLHCNLMHY